MQTEQLPDPTAPLLRPAGQEADPAPLRASHVSRRRSPHNGGIEPGHRALQGEPFRGGRERWRVGLPGEL
jgi:hypothetical protein